MRRQAPSPQACLRATGPTLEISCQVHRVPAVVSGETEVLPATHWTPRFLLDPTSQQLSNRGRGSVPREDLGTYGWGAGRAAVQLQMEWAMWAEPTPTEGFSRGDSGLSPAWQLRVRPWLILPPRAPRRQTWTWRLPPSNVWSKLRKKRL